MYANMNGTKWTNCEWEDSLLPQASIHDVKWKEMTIHECDLSGCEIMHASMKGMDLRTSVIDGIAVDLKDLKGCIVNYEQALSLAQLLGIIIRE